MDFGRPGILSDEDPERGQDEPSGRDDQFDRDSHDPDRGDHDLATNTSFEEDLRLQGGPAPTEDEPPEPDREEDEAMNTRMHDAKAVARVREAGPESVEYRLLREALIEVALGMLTMMGPHRILREMRKRGMFVPVPAPVSFAEELPTLRYEAIRAVVENFMKVQVLDGGWDPNGKASLRTFFTNKVIYRIATEYRRYYREEISRELVYGTVSDGDDDLAGAVIELPAGPASDPEATAINRAHIRDILPDASSEVVEIVRLAWLGYTQREIARRMNITEAKVNSALRRLRKKHGP